MFSAPMETTFWLAGERCFPAEQRKAFDRYSRLPNSRSRRPCGPVRSVRTLRHLLQLVSQPELSEVPGRGSRPVAGRTGSRVVAGGEYFHVVFTLPQQIARLALQNARRIYRHPLPRGGRDTADDRGGPQASRGGHRLPGRASHLGSESPSPPAYSLRGAWRRDQPRPARGGSLVAESRSSFPSGSSAASSARGS